MNSQKSEAKTAPGSESGKLQRANRLRQVAEHYPSRLGLFKAVYAGKTSPRNCIKAFCLECNGWEMAAIRDCASMGCPLWRLRPYQQTNNTNTKEESI